MMTASLLTLVALVVWGTLVGLDLVSVPQVMIARPVVAGGVAGLLLGDVESGLRVGVVFELFALDVLPVGAASYPDYGPATVAATALAAGAPWELGLGVSGALGLLFGALGGWSQRWVRRANARAVQRRTAALAAGDTRAIRELERAGIARDAVRSALLTALGLAVAALTARYLQLDRETAAALTLALIGTALAAALDGAVRSAGRGRRLGWLVAGGGLGLLVAALA